MRILIEEERINSKLGERLAALELGIQLVQGAGVERTLELTDGPGIASNEPATPKLDVDFFELDSGGGRDTGAATQVSSATGDNLTGHLCGWPHRGGRRPATRVLGGGGPSVALEGGSAADDAHPGGGGEHREGQDPGQLGALPGQGGVVWEAAGGKHDEAYSFGEHRPGGTSGPSGDGVQQAAEEGQETQESEVHLGDQFDGATQEGEKEVQEGDEGAEEGDVAQSGDQQRECPPAVQVTIEGGCITEGGTVEDGASAEGKIPDSTVGTLKMPGAAAHCDANVPLKLAGELEPGTLLKFKGQQCEVVGYVSKKGKHGGNRRRMVVQDINTGKKYSNLEPMAEYELLGELGVALEEEVLPKVPLFPILEATETDEVAKDADEAEQKQQMLKQLLEAARALKENGILDVGDGLDDVKGILSGA